MYFQSKRIHRSSLFVGKIRSFIVLFLSLILITNLLQNNNAVTGFPVFTTATSSSRSKLQFHHHHHISSLVMSRSHNAPWLRRGERSTATDENEYKDTNNINIDINTKSINSDLATPTMNKVEKRILLVWFHAVIAFVLWNYYTTSTLWPAILLTIPLKFWNLLHALSAMAFAGGIVTTTLLEWKLPIVGGDTEQSKLLNWLWQVESKLVLPAVSMSLVSGVVQSHMYYNTLKSAPPHVKGALHIMALFAIWWAWTDRRSQSSLREGGFDETKVIQRRFSNLVSCGFLLALYSMMVLKPGF